jgi:hypothetical protein
MMLGKLYAALRLAGIPDEKAVEAAEEVAQFESRLASVDTRLTLLTWMVAFNLALTMGVLAKLFR